VTKTRGRVAGLPAALSRLVTLLVLAMAVLIGPARAEILLSDAAGRTVRLAEPARRIVTNESLLLLSLALVDADPLARIAGWAAPQRIDRGMYEAYRRRFPTIDAIPTVWRGSASENTRSRRSFP
jgi:iron complex transport system substrate-binding protein